MTNRGLSLRRLKASRAKSFLGSTWVWLKNSYPQWVAHGNRDQKQPAVQFLVVLTHTHVAPKQSPSGLGARGSGSIRPERLGSRVSVSGVQGEFFQPLGTLTIRGLRGPELGAVDRNFPKTTVVRRAAVHDFICEMPIV